MKTDPEGRCSGCEQLRTQLAEANAEHARQRSDLIRLVTALADDRLGARARALNYLATECS